jgi:hypothetical protein
MSDFDTEEIDNLSSQELVTLFNDFLYDLLKQLHGIVKSDEDIKYYFNMFKDLVKMQRTLVIDQFIIHILEYYDEIKNKNEEFFMNEDVTKKKLGDNVISKVFKFKKLFQQLTKKEKEMLFYYLNILCYISARYFTLNN